jgi:hypothetical protein
LPKNVRMKKKEVFFMWDKKVNKLHMKTKCLKKMKCIPRKEDHWYVPCFEIKPHPKYVLQSPKNPLAHPKCKGHLWPKCNVEEYVCLESSLMDSKTYILTPWSLSPTRVNWVKRWSKARVISLNIMWVLSAKDGKT